MLEPNIDWRAYVEQMAPLQGYALNPEQATRVMAQLELIAQVVAPLLDVALPAEVEPAAVFRP